MKNNRGFTLVEILIVLVILGTILTTVVRPIMNNFENSKIKTTKLAASQISSAIQLFSADCGKYPSELKHLSVADPDCGSWGPNAYLKTVPKDGWNRDFVYESDGSTYTLKSLGKDGKEGGTGANADIEPEE